MKRFDWTRYVVLAVGVAISTVLLLLVLDAVGVPETNLRAALTGIFGGGVMVLAGRRIGLFSARRDD